MRTKREIEKEMRELFPKKELAYMDARQNEGGGIADRMWMEFRTLRDRWNDLVDEFEKSE